KLKNRKKKNHKDCIFHFPTKESKSLGDDVADAVIFNSTFRFRETCCHRAGNQSQSRKIGKQPVGLLFMKNIAFLIAVGLILGASPVYAVTITFDEFGTGVQGSPVGASYSATGVTFSDATFVTNFGLAGSSGSTGMWDTTEGGLPSPASPIIAIFSPTATFASIVALSVGENGAQMNAYDAAVGGNLIASDQAFGTGFGDGNFVTLSVTATGIQRIELFQPQNLGNGDALVFDTFSFELGGPAAVPDESSSLVLAALSGLAFLAFKRVPLFGWS
ncbi:MAG: hypothetical protein M3R29_00685, partial [Verrucomicrobiota bacterium]|nr:hypothetical protein [Verrucomicrobiota bacterium]